METVAMFYTGFKVTNKNEWREYLQAQEILVWILLEYGNWQIYAKTAKC